MELFRVVTLKKEKDRPGGLAGLLHLRGVGTKVVECVAAHFDEETTVLFHCAD